MINFDALITLAAIQLSVSLLEDYVGLIFVQNMQNIY